MNKVEMLGVHKPASFSFIVYSHLRWDFVWQRPQQILSRLAVEHPILFVEEPLYHASNKARLDITHPYANVVRVVPHLNSDSAHDYDGAMEIVRDLLQEKLHNDLLLRQTFYQRVLWFYTPMPVTIMAGEFDEKGIVYDCMDELAQFKNAPTELRDREKLLLKKAQVVFTGGRNLYESKSRLHDNVHFFGCGVDIDHFGKARHPETTIPEELKDIRTPIAGYFGVIDERLDYALIERLAREHAEWTFAMVGPVVKVSTSILPQAPNIKWLGQRDYKDLPNFVKAYDVCLMPFALNEATQYINPTKTLEYMAAHKPILSTAVPDVVKNFAPIVQIARTQDEFVQKLSSTRHLPKSTLAAGLRMAREASWEAIVDNIKHLIKTSVSKRIVTHPPRSKLALGGVVNAVEV